jgi:hypothetical protein
VAVSATETAKVRAMASEKELVGKLGFVRKQKAEGRRQKTE